MNTYIPKGLYEDISNENAVHEIFSRYFSSNVLLEPIESEFEKCRAELKQIGETRISDLLEQLITIG